MFFLGKMPFPNVISLQNAGIGYVKKEHLHIGLCISTRETDLGQCTVMLQGLSPAVHSSGYADTRNRGNKYWYNEPGTSTNQTMSLTGWQVVDQGNQGCSAQLHIGLKYACACELHVRCLRSLVMIWFVSRIFNTAMHFGDPCAEQIHQREGVLHSGETI